MKVRGVEESGTHATHTVWRSATRLTANDANRAQIFEGRENIIAFLTRKWQRELDSRLIKELWAFIENRTAVRFAYEYHDDSGNSFRALWQRKLEYDEFGLNRQRQTSINDRPILQAERKFYWDRSGPRPADDPSPGDLDL